MVILTAVLVLGIMGLIFGIVLDFASKKFAVEVDERVEAILGYFQEPTVEVVDFQVVEVLQMQ